MPSKDVSLDYWDCGQLVIESFPKDGLDFKYWDSSLFFTLVTNVPIVNGSKSDIGIIEYAKADVYYPLNAPTFVEYGASVRLVSA